MLKPSVIAAYEAVPWVTIATVLPVLMVALIFEERFFDESDREPAQGPLFKQGVALAVDSVR